MTRVEAIAVAKRFVSVHHLPVGKVADAQHTTAEEYTGCGLDLGHGDWLVSFHYVGSVAPSHPKVTLRMDVGWLLCVQVNDMSAQAELWQDYRDEQQASSQAVFVHKNG
jgi:hypothetical protein